MRKGIVLILVALFLFLSFGNMVIAQRGPAPSAGDSISDGSGWDKPLELG